MAYYKHILVGLDLSLSKESQQVIDRVKQLLTDRPVETLPKVTLMHVQKPLSFAYGGDIPMDLSDIQTQLGEQAAEKLQELAKQFNVPSIDQHVVIGQTAQEIQGFTEQHGVDLIVVGSHGRHGLSLMFGSAANSVLHAANCDVLAVRIPD
jgi:universal stress protein A